jgi:predicted CoA-binding protein
MSDKPIKRTVIIGATANRARYAYLAAMMLTEAGHPIIPVGIKKGDVLGDEILDIRTRPQIPDVDTITLYINASRQAEWQDYILGLYPKRIIFNPGAENEVLRAKAEKLDIRTENACTLVLIQTGQY